MLGELVHDRANNDIYEGHPLWNGRTIRISIPVDEGEPSVAAIETLHSLWARQEAVDLDARQYVARSIFDGTESSWWSQEDDPPSATEFAELLSLTEITIDHTNHPDGYTLWFDESQVFGGHTLSVSASLSEGYLDKPTV